MTFMKKALYIIIAAYSAFLFSGCKVGQKYVSPTLNGMPNTFEALTVTPISVTDIGWSTLYKDSILQSYIIKALDHNKDLRIAVSRIKEMEANKRISFANMFPSLNYGSESYRKLENYGGDAAAYTNKINANVNVSWEVDVWGKLRWANDAGIASYLQTLEAQRSLKLTLVAEVAQSYFELEALDKELKIVKQTLEARKEGVRFAKLRYDGGLTSEIPYRQSLVELARTETLIPSLEQSIKLKENDLFVLMGEYPSGMLLREDSFSDQHPQDLPIEFPSIILKRRPDVIQVEQELIAANAKIGMAYTDMFPKIQLSGRIGGENDQLADFIKSPAWLIDGLITGPIFNMGKNKAKYKAAQAAYEQANFKYEKKVLDVFKEVNNAIISFSKTKDIYKSDEQLYSSAKANENLVKIQYVNGSASYIDLLDAQRQLFDAEVALNRADLNKLLSVVTLYKVLGGGLNQ